MIRTVVEIEDYTNPQGTKEAVAMALERLGRVRVVSVEEIKPTYEQTRIGGNKNDARN